MAEAQTISAENLCSLTGLTDRRHRQLARDGYFPAPIKGQYQASQVIKGVLRYYRELHQRRDKALAEKREQKLDRENELLTLQIAEKKKLSISIDEMATRLTPALSSMRRRILSSGLNEAERDDLLGDLGKLLDDAIRKSKPMGSCGKRDKADPDPTPESDG